MDVTPLMDAYIKKNGGRVCRWSDDLLLPGVRSASRLPKKPESVAVFAFPYRTDVGEKRNLALYATLPDYHGVCMKRLEAISAELKKICPEGEFVPFCDASPVNEVRAAARAGTGLLGENNLVASSEYGFFIFIGEIVTDVPLSCEKEEIRRCTGCKRCIKACPSGALSNEGFDKNKCRSHFTQKKGSLSPLEEEEIKKGGLAWGCDECIMSCPMSLEAEFTDIEEFSGDVVPVLTRDNLDRLMKNRAFSWRGRAVLERNLDLINGK